MNITCDNIFCKVCTRRNTSVATKILFHFCSRQVGHLSKTKHTTTDSCPLMVQWSNADPINQIHRQNVGWPAASGGQAAASRAEFSTLLCKPLRFSSFQKVSKWFINHIYIYISPIFHPILVEIPNLYRGYKPFSGARTPKLGSPTPDTQRGLGFSPCSSLLSSEFQRYLRYLGTWTFGVVVLSKIHVDCDYN